MTQVAKFPKVHNRKPQNAGDVQGPVGILGFINDFCTVMYTLPNARLKADELLIFIISYVTDLLNKVLPYEPSIHRLHLA